MARIFPRNWQKELAALLLLLLAVQLLLAWREAVVARQLEAELEAELALEQRALGGAQILLLAEGTSASNRHPISCTTVYVRGERWYAIS